MLSLTKLERVLLMNQYAILEQLEPENEAYREFKDIVQYGYAYNYGRITEWVSEEMKSESSSFVWDVFETYNMLFKSFEQLSDEDKKSIDEEKLRFQGFSGNEEGEEMAYATFILKVLKRYAYLFPNQNCEDVSLDSHFPLKDKYREMLRRKKEIHKEDFYRLSKDQINYILGENLNHTR